MGKPELRRDCPMCRTPLGEGPDGSRRCPVCHYACRICPACGGLMEERVEAPEGVGIEAEGLPLDRCRSLWVCGDPGCGARLEVEG